MERPLVFGMQVDNFEKLKEDIGSEMVDKLYSGEKIRVRMELESFQADGKYGAAEGEYVKLVKD